MVATRKRALTPEDTTPSAEEVHNEPVTTENSNSAEDPKKTEDSPADKHPKIGTDAMAVGENVKNKQASTDEHGEPDKNIKGRESTVNAVAENKENETNNNECKVSASTASPHEVSVHCC